MRTLALFALALAGCSSHDAPAPDDDGQPARLGQLAYEAPLAWSHSDSTTLRGPSTQWTPEVNPRKESIIVTRSKIQPGFPELDTAGLQALAIGVQQQLPHVRVGKTEPFTTTLGMHGVRVESDFVPAGSTARYTRIHAVMFDGDSLVHVMYTARDTDGGQAFDLVVNSVHGEA